MTSLYVLAGVLALLALGGAVFVFIRLPFVKALFSTVLLWLMLVMGGVLLVPQIVSLDQFKPKVITAVYDATGRDLKINGPIGFTIWPVLGLTLNDVTFSNAPGAKNADMLSMKSASVGVQMRPLLDKKIRITEFRLVEPNILLTTDANGQGNWVFSKAKTKAEKAAASNSRIPGQVKGWSDLQISGFEIVDGRLSYRPAKGQAVELGKLNLKLDLPALDRPMSLKGDVEFRARTLAFDLDIATPLALISEKTSPIKADITLGPDNIRFDGVLKSAAYSGDIKGTVKDLADLVAWATVKPAAPLPFATATFSGAVNGDAGKGRIEKLSMQLDDMLLTGGASAAWTGKPSITANIVTGVIDLDRFMNAETTMPDGVTDKVETAPDLSGLNAVNADITARLDGLIAKGVTLGATTVKLKLANGQLNAGITPASLFGGTVAGDATVSGASFTANARLDGVEMEPALTRFAGFDRLSGKGDLSMAVRGPMGTADAIKRGLSGNGKFMLRNGALKGVNLAATVRNAKSFLSGEAQAKGEVQQTDFTELSGTFTIGNGIVTNNDLKMLSPLLRIAGHGTVDLPQSTVNYRVDATLVADITGQGATAEKTGLLVPVNIRGPFSNLSYTPDLQGLLTGNMESGGKLIESVQDAARNLKGSDLKNAGKKAVRGQLEQLLGVKPQPEPEIAPASTESSIPADGAATGPAPTARPDPRQELLKNLLSR